MKKFFYDIETTGLNESKNSIHQIAGYIEIDNKIVESFNIKVRPHPKAVIESNALRICNVTKEQIMEYQDMETAHRKLIAILNKYVNRFNPADKMWLVGYNNNSFDNKFFRMFFLLCKDEFFGAWFWSDSLDVMVLASQYLLTRRKNMPSFQLKHVAIELGLLVNNEKLHDAFYDVKLTHDIYQIVTGLEIE